MCIAQILPWEKVYWDEWNNYEAFGTHSRVHAKATLSPAALSNYWACRGNRARPSARCRTFLVNILCSETAHWPTYNFLTASLFLADPPSFAISFHRCQTFLVLLPVPLSFVVIFVLLILSWHLLLKDLYWYTQSCLTFVGCCCITYDRTWILFVSIKCCAMDFRMMAKKNHECC